MGKERTSQSPSFTSSHPSGAPNPELAALPSLFLLDGRNRAFIDGKSGKIAGASGWVNFFVLLICLVPIFFLLNALPQWNERRRLSNSRATTQGTIVSRTAEFPLSTNDVFGYSAPRLLEFSDSGVGRAVIDQQGECGDSGK